MKKYKIIEGNYDDFIKYNGLKHKNNGEARTSTFHRYLNSIIVHRGQEP